MIPNKTHSEMISLKSVSNYFVWITSILFFLLAVSLLIEKRYTDLSRITGTSNTQQSTDVIGEEDYLLKSLNSNEPEINNKVSLIDDVLRLGFFSKFIILLIALNWLNKKLISSQTSKETYRRF